MRAFSFTFSFVLFHQVILSFLQRRAPVSIHQDKYGDPDLDVIKELPIVLEQFFAVYFL